MSPGLHLLLHDAVGFFSVLVMAALGFVVLLKDHRTTVNVTLGLTFLGVIAVFTANIIGVSVSDPLLSRGILIWSVLLSATAAFNLHCALAIIGRDREERWFIAFVYALAAALIAAAVIAPDTFLLPSVAQLYFPSYYVPGILQLPFTLIFKAIVPAYFVWRLFAASRATEDAVERRRTSYFAWAFMLGWAFGLIPSFLIFGVPVDPIWGMVCPVLFAVPFTYAIFRYEILDIRVVATRTALYAIAVISIGVIDGFMDLAGEWIRRIDPAFPSWTISLANAVIVVGAGVMVWQQLRDSEHMKDEFITTVTHKFRTPLTHIKWATEGLKPSLSTPQSLEQLSYIEGASAKLVELTDILAKTSDSTEGLYRYRLETADLSAFADDVMRGSAGHARAAKVSLTAEIEPGVRAIFDATRLRFVLQTLIENAINYTPSGGTVTVRLSREGGKAVCSVGDTGIGIPRHELPHVGTKLFRGARARTTDTEGMGIGLYIARGIIARHNGKLHIQSEGDDRGSTFSFTVPIAE